MAASSSTNVPANWIDQQKLRARCNCLCFTAPDMARLWTGISTWPGGLTSGTTVFGEISSTVYVAEAAISTPWTAFEHVQCYLLSNAKGMH